MEKMIITIGRQFGSGGRELAQKLAEELNCKYYDKELLAVAAKESGLSAEFLNEYDERSTNSFLYSLVMNTQQNLWNGKANHTLDELAMDAQREALLTAASENCVIVGRCADYVLRKEAGLVRIFVSAEKEDRIQRVMKRDQMSREDAESKIKRMDKSRKAYYDYYTNGGWGEARSYDICLNISRTGIEGAIEIIRKYLEIGQ